jgi:NADH-quinone oxidoreductase subunit I
MYGWGVIKTLGIALKHFAGTYVEDGKRWLRRGEEEVEGYAPLGREGIFTLRYPDERRALPERSRNLPFLVVDGETGALRCTACGICARVCPVQCIWIERAEDPETGRPLRHPASYHLDVSLCMCCGYCAEFCPFDAVKMDHEYEVATYERPGFRDAEELAKPESYHASIHPQDHAGEE